MNHFLIAYVDNPMCDVGVTPKVYKLSRACGPDDVTVPERTLCFIFVTSKLQTAEELTETLIGIRFENFISLIRSTDSHLESCLYCIGKEQCDEHGKKWIYNPYTKTRLASALLWKNYKLIDM